MLHAATLTSAYEFKGNLADSVLQGNDADLVTGTKGVGSGTASATSFSFAINQGFTLSNAVPNIDNYSVEMNFNLSAIFANGFGSILDPGSARDDNNLYLLTSGAIQFWNQPATVANVILLNQSAHFVFTRDGATGNFDLYVDGVLRGSAQNNGATSQASGNVIHFFEDDGSEGSAGVVEYIRLYDGYMTGAEVTTLYNNRNVALVFGPSVTSTTTFNSTALDSFWIDGKNAGNGFGNYSQTNATGAVVISGGTLKPQTNFTGSTGYIPDYGQSFTLLTGSSVVGSYTTIDSSANPSAIKFIAEYRDQQVNVIATPGDYARDISGLSPSQQALGRALNNVVTSSVDRRAGALQSPREKLTAGLMGLTTRELRSALNEMDPAQLQPMSQVVLQGAQALQGGFIGRIDQLQAGTRGGVTVNGMAMTDLEGEYEVESIASIESPIILKRKKHSWSYWMNGTGNWGEVESEAQNSGYRFYGMGSQIGMDHTASNGWTTGLMLWEGYGKSDLSRMNATLENHRGGGGFYVHKEWHGFYWGGYAGAGKLFYDTERTLSFLGDKAKGKTEGVVAQGWSEGGYEVRMKNWGFGPTAGVGYDRVSIDRYREEGSVAGLEIADQVQESLRHQLGFRVQNFWKYHGVGFQPHLRVSWDHEYLDPKKITSRLNAGGDWFRSETRKLDVDSMSAGVGFSVLPDTHWRVNTSYQTQLLAKSYTAHRIDLGIQYGF